MKLIKYRQSDPIEYRPEIDGLRAIAVLAVVFYHAKLPWFDGGFIGVDIFFVISGFLISRAIIDDLSKGTFSWLYFYEKRARRIFPAIFIMTFICSLIAVTVMPPNHLQSFGMSVVSLILFGSNFFFWLDTDYFSIGAEMKPLLHTWSLALEEQYYAILPAILVLSWQLKRVNFILLFLGIFFCSFSLAIFSTMPDEHPRIVESAFYLLPARMWEFFIGVGAALALSTGLNFTRPLSEFLCLLGILAIFGSILGFNKQTPTPSFITLAPTLGTFTLIVFGRNSSIAMRCLSLWVLRNLGLISYGVYLWHFPLLSFALYVYGDQIPMYLTLSLCLLAVSLGYLSWKYVETPIRNRAGVDSRKFWNKVFCSFIALFALGSFLVKTDGLFQFQSLADQKIYQHFKPSEQNHNALFEEHHLNTFDQNDKTRNIVIVGDSFAQEMMAILYTAGLANELSLSSFFIPSECGILFYENHLKRYSGSTDSFCKDNGYHLSNAKLTQIFKSANEIWLVSAWNIEFIERIKPTMLNLLDLNQNIRLFGRKNFDYISEIEFMKYGIGPWLDIRDSKILIEAQQKAGKLKEVIADLPIDFIDVQSLLCDGNAMCPNHDGIGLITYDGAHLTRYGLDKFGEVLKAEVKPFNSIK